MGAIAFALLISGGLKALQTADVVCGLLILVLALVICVSYIKCMKSAKDYDIVGTFDVNEAKNKEIKNVEKVKNEQIELEL